MPARMDGMVRKFCTKNVCVLQFATFAFERLVQHAR